MKRYPKYIYSSLLFIIPYLTNRINKKNETSERYHSDIFHGRKIEPLSDKLVNSS